MNCDAFLAALDLPPSSRVDQRVPKKLLLENGAPTTADKRYINDGVEALHWLAALKPTTIGVPEFRDEIREYLEIAVLRLALRPGAKVIRLVELAHRAIPYPVLLLTEHEREPGISVAHKRWSQGEAGKTVLEDEVIALDWSPERDAAYMFFFQDAMALGRQPRTTLYALYQGWVDTLLALHSARLTSVFVLPANAEQSSARRDALRECVRLDKEIARLHAAASKEKQMARRVELNIEIKRLEARQASAKTRL